MIRSLASLALLYSCSTAPLETPPVSAGVSIKSNDAGLEKKVRGVCQQSQNVMGLYSCLTGGKYTRDQCFEKYCEQ